MRLDLLRIQFLYLDFYTNCKLNQFSFYTSHKIRSLALLTDMEYTFRLLQLKLASDLGEHRLYYVPGYCSHLYMNFCLEMIKSPIKHKEIDRVFNENLFKKSDVINCLINSFFNIDCQGKLFDTYVYVLDKAFSKQTPAIIKSYNDLLDNSMLPHVKHKDIFNNSSVDMEDGASFIIINNIQKTLMMGGKEFIAVDFVTQVNLSDANSKKDLEQLARLFTTLENNYRRIIIFKSEEFIKVNPDKFKIMDKNLNDYKNVTKSILVNQILKELPVSEKGEWSDVLVIIDAISANVIDEMVRILYNSPGFAFVIKTNHFLTCFSLETATKDISEAGYNGILGIRVEVRDIETNKIV